MESSWQLRATGLASALALLAAPLGAQGVPRSEAGTGPLQQLGTAIEALARRVSPAVVQVLVTGLGASQSQSGEGVLERQRVIGSGVIVDSAGFIVTNAHVVRGAGRVRVALTVAPEPENPGGRPIVGPVLEARVIGLDVETDLAVLKVDTTRLPALRFGDSDRLRKGELVFAFGSPAGLANSVTMGVVSSVARELDPERPVVYIQTDAPINPGNSGGPLVDGNGTVVGINTLILSESGGSEGLGFAIPSGIAQFVYQELRRHGHVHRGIIGATALEITPLLASALGLPRNYGLLLEDVAPGGPAAVAGLTIGDVVVALNDQPVANLAEFVTELTLRNVGRTVRLDVLRGSDHLTIDVPVAEQRDSLDRLIATVDPEQNLVPSIGIVGVTLDSGIVGQLPELRVPEGVLVVARAGAAVSGLEPGDVIHGMNRSRVTSLEELRTAVQGFRPGDVIVLEIERDGGFHYMPLEID
jgi:serine protease Do